VTNRVRPEGSPRLAWTTTTAFVLAMLVAGADPRAALAEDAAAAALRQEMERLKGDVELAYLDVKTDHERVRAADWDRTPFAKAFESAFAEFVRDARARTESAGDAEAAASLVQTLSAKRIGPPLTTTSLPIVLAEAARGARADAKAAAREIFLAAGRRVFSEAKVEDAWDTRFIGLPVVQAFRAARSKLETQERLAAGPSPSAVVEKPVERPLDEMVLCDRPRPWVGPWTGWVADVPEKQNRRQPRALKPVWIDKYETTCGQYRAWLESLPAPTRRAHLPQGWTIGDDDVVQSPTGKDRHPVVGVTWRQAQSYAESCGKRLPTADEWDRAAAGGDKDARVFPWGASEEGKSWAHLGVEPKATHPVDAFPDDETPDGVVGMAGNVAEIVSTCSDRSDVGRSGPEKGKQVVVCGGSFVSRVSDCMTSYRWVLDESGSSSSVGFRCVMDDAEYRKRNKK
jgi:formylglycine-generating enzyme required for sulfatase activity